MRVAAIECVSIGLVEVNSQTVQRNNRVVSEARLIGFFHNVHGYNLCEHLICYAGRWSLMEYRHNGRLSISYLSKYF